MRDADARALPVLLVGGGSNLVVSDAGFDGRAVHIDTREISLNSRGDRVLVRAAAGEPWDALVARCVAEDLAGVECLSGIPGSVGATPIQNVGAYGQEVSDTLDSVELYDRNTRAIVNFSAAECGLSYRDSAFKRAHRGRYVVLSATFALRPGGECAIRYGELSTALSGLRATRDLSRVRETVIALRRAKSMVLDEGDPETRSAGSFFMNPVVSAPEAAAVDARARALGAATDARPMPRFEASEGRVKLAAGWLIERAGISRGTPFGGVGVSHKHALALVNRGGTAAEIVELARHIRGRVREVFGVELHPEPVFAGFGVDDPTV